MYTNVFNTDAYDVKKLNEYFTNIATGPTYNITSLLLYKEKTSDFQLSNNLSLNEYNLLTQIAKIKKTSPGPYNIPYWFLQNLQREFSACCTNNSSYWHFPNQMETCYNNAVYLRFLNPKFLAIFALFLLRLSSPGFSNVCLSKYAFFLSSLRNY